MKRILTLAVILLFSLWPVAAQKKYPANYATEPRFKALIYYTHYAEQAHVDFAHQAIAFFQKLTVGDGFILDYTDDFDAVASRLSDYNLIIMLNAAPQSKAAREAFEAYIEAGGGWMGFHAAAYNDKHTHWPWFNQFLGCGHFYCNNWPPQPALVKVDKRKHEVMRTLPKEFIIPASEFYQWEPSPRRNKDVDVLLSISKKMYPFGIKDVVNFGDFPIVWTNRRYRMIYLNMGHGDEAFISPTQNLLFTNAFRWVVSQTRTGNPLEK